VSFKNRKRDSLLQKKKDNMMMEARDWSDRRKGLKPK
jgi:hypothetical protein